MMESLQKREPIEAEEKGGGRKGEGCPTDVCVSLSDGSSGSPVNVEFCPDRKLHHPYSWHTIPRSSRHTVFLSTRTLSTLAYKTNSN